MFGSRLDLFMKCLLDSMVLNFAPDNTDRMILKKYFLNLLILYYIGTLILLEISVLILLRSKKSAKTSKVFLVL